VISHNVTAGAILKFVMVGGGSRNYHPIRS